MEDLNQAIKSFATVVPNVPAELGDFGNFVRPIVGRVHSALTLAFDAPPSQSVTEHLRDHLFDSLVAQSLGIECPECGRFRMDVAVRRENTAYVEDSSNWIYCCFECYEERQGHWAEQWAEYYSSVLG